MKSSFSMAFSQAMHGVQALAWPLMYEKISTRLKPELHASA